MPTFAIHIGKMHKQQKVMIFMNSARQCLSHAAEAAAELTCKQGTIQTSILHNASSKMRFLHRDHLQD